MLSIGFWSSALSSRLSATRAVAPWRLDARHVHHFWVISSISVIPALRRFQVIGGEQQLQLQGGMVASSSVECSWNWGIGCSWAARWRHPFIGTARLRIQLCDSRRKLWNKVGQFSAGGGLYFIIFYYLFNIFLIHVLLIFLKAQIIESHIELCKKMVFYWLVWGCLPLLVSQAQSILSLKFLWSTTINS